MPALLLFLVLTFGVSWAIAYGLHAMGGYAGAGVMLGPILIAYMFGPAVGALIASLIFDRGRVLEALGFRKLKPGQVALWLLYGWLTPVLLTALAGLATIAISGQDIADAASTLWTAAEAAGGAEQLEAAGLTPEFLLLLTLTVNLPIGMLINTLLITLNEELGWRGWLQPRLAGLGFWRMSLVIGVIWGVWHAPLVLMGHNYPGLGWTGVALMTGWTILLTPYLALARERGGGVWAAGAFHGSLNAVVGIGLLFQTQTSWPWNGLLGAAGFAVLAAGWALIALYRRGRPVDGHGDET